MPARRHLPLAALLLLAGCGGDPAPAPAEPAKPAAVSHAERELRKVGAASAVGYDGEALEHDVRHSVETQEAKAAETEAARRAATGE